MPTRERPPLRKLTRAKLKPSDGPLARIVAEHSALLPLDRSCGPDGYRVAVALARWRKGNLITYRPEGD